MANWIEENIEDFEATNYDNRAADIARELVFAYGADYDSGDELAAYGDIHYAGYLSDASVWFIQDNLLLGGWFIGRCDDRYDDSEYTNYQINDDFDRRCIFDLDDAVNTIDGSWGGPYVDDPAGYSHTLDELSPDAADYAIRNWISEDEKQNLITESLEDLNNRPFVTSLQLSFGIEDRGFYPLQLDMGSNDQLTFDEAYAASYARDDEEYAEYLLEDYDNVLNAFPFDIIDQYGEVKSVDDADWGLASDNDNLWNLDYKPQVETLLAEVNEELEEFDNAVAADKPYIAADIVDKIKLSYDVRDEGFSWIWKQVEDSFNSMFEKEFEFYHMIPAFEYDGSRIYHSEHPTYPTGDISR